MNPDDSRSSSHELPTICSDHPVVGDGIPQPKPQPFRRVSGIAYALLGILVLGLVLGLCLPGEWGVFFAASKEAAVMGLIGVLAYVGLESRIAHGCAWLLLGTVLCFMVGINVAMIGMTYGTFGNHAGAHVLPPGALRMMVCVAVVSVMAALTAFLPLFRGLRHPFSAITGIEEWTPVRMVAMGGVVALTLMLCIPLVFLGQAPMTSLLEQDGRAAEMVSVASKDAGKELRGDLYSLCWSLLASALAVGFGVRRNWRECMDRLGLARLSARQITLALALAALMYVLSGWLDTGISHVWDFFSWPTTDEKAYGILTKSATSLVGAVVTGITAGIGEEVMVRGMLQPRVGILCSNLFFTALHAYQYNWDQLVSVFVFGILLGVIRKRTCTTTCIIIHGSYDFVVLTIATLS